MITINNWPKVLRYTIIALAIIYVGLSIGCAVNKFSNENKQYEKKITLSKETFTMPKAVVENDMAADTDSIVKTYELVSERLKTVERLVENYQTDANVVIVKANHFVELWLEITSIFIALFSILVTLYNYLQAKDIKDDLQHKKNDLTEDLQSKKTEIEKEWKELRNNIEDLIIEQKNKFAIQARIGKVNSIVGCLSSLPDPLLSNGMNKNRYADEYLSILCYEFDQYVNSIRQEIKRIENDCNYNFDELINNAAIIISGIYVVIIRIQYLYTNLQQGVAFIKFSDNLSFMMNNFLDKKLNRNNFVNELNELANAFKQFNAVVVNGY